MKSKIRRRHKSGLLVYSGGGILERRILKREVRKIRRSLDRIVLKEVLQEI